MTPRLIKSFFTGKCRTCGKTTAKGEQVWFAKHYGIRCEACGPHTSSDQPLPSKKGKKATRASSRPPVPAAPASIASQPPATPLRGSGFIPMYTPASADTRLPAEAGPDGVFRLTWSSMTALVEDAFTKYGQTAASKEYLDTLHAKQAGDRWANGHTEKSLRKAVRQPAATLMAAIDDMRNALVDELELPTTTRRKVRRGLDWGDELDADRYLAREPNVWERSVRDPSTRRSVTIGVNLTVAAGQEADDLLYRGAAAVALAAH